GRTGAKSRSSTPRPSRSAATAEPRAAGAPSRARTFTSSRKVSVKSCQKKDSVSMSARAKSNSSCAAVTVAHDEFDFARALMETESFFWHDFTDTFLELVKVRARDGAPAARGSAVAALRLGLGVLLRLFAPVLPYITAEPWSWAFAGATGYASI